MRTKKLSSAQPVEGCEFEAEEEDRKKGPSDEAGLLSGSTGVYRKHRWLEISFLSLVSSCYLVVLAPNLRLPTPRSPLFISTSQQYPRASENERGTRREGEREREKEKNEREEAMYPRNKLSVVHGRRDDTIRGRIDRCLFCHPLSRI